MEHQMETIKKTPLKRPREVQQTILKAIAARLSEFARAASRDVFDGLSQTRGN
jgi:hypothetical protein